MKYITAIICLFLIAGCSDDTSEPAAAIKTETSVPASTERSDTEEFAMEIKDFFITAADQVVVTGQITSGTVVTGDMICVSSRTDHRVNAEVVGIEQFNQNIEQAGAGDDVSIMLGGIEKDEVGKGYRLRSCQ